MPTITEIPDSFWALFRSWNRQLYMEALLALNEEYQYNNYFISWDACLQVLDSFFAERQLFLYEEDSEPDGETKQSPAVRTLNWLIRQGWLLKQEDYARGITNVVIPDYTAIFLDAFHRLYHEEEDEANVYIRNVYASVFSYMHDTRKDLNLLKAALSNTRILNKTLQNMLHNMNRFFGSMLEQESYEDLLEEHLNGYVEEIVQKKYRILKTSDNFYLYKNDIKKWLLEIDETAMEQMLSFPDGDIKEGSQAWILQEEHRLIGEISRGFDDIEKRISYLDQEHMKYLRATTTRLNYLINEDRDTRGLLIRLLNTLSQDPEKLSSRLSRTADAMHLGSLEVLSDKRFYKKRKPKASFASQLLPDLEEPSLTQAEVLRMNRTHNKYSRSEIEAFIEDHLKEGAFTADAQAVSNSEDFEKLILSYDYAVRKDSLYEASTDGSESVHAGSYHYPEIHFQRRSKDK